MEIELHSKVLKFAQTMQAELDANQHKGNWEEWIDLKDILNELEYHKAKLLFALRDNKKEEVKEYLADCANILLCLGNAGELY